MDKQARIYVAGHRGLAGSALVRKLQSAGFNNLLVRSSNELDLRRQADVEAFFRENMPDYVFLAAAKVGGIHANNTYPADFIHDNVTIQTNIIHAAYISGVKKLLFLGSSCIYPKHCPQPMKEEYLLSGCLEPTNEPYAVAKIAGIKMCEAYNRQYGTNFISVMPTNLYGPGDNYDLHNSHVLPALIRKFHEAKVEGSPSVEVWGTGTPRREFLYVDDLADACFFLMQQYDDGKIVNIGVGEDLSILELALLIKEIVGYEGELRFDSSKPDGTPKKLLDVTKLLNMGWKAQVGLADGIKRAYDAYLVSIDMGEVQ
ncbi:GDP-L-fucose synthase [Geobacter argillaceus]|uniref:GDP-L-fucose synthase n=1 Tax=Geobacter argillaceus TaxID=345631 RepID=A0A562VFR5_9BACT|nr:GDP-L-fucose synthase [Geobacter argillaceus]TWJ16722.1 GDP-L-fucose synthase [Geobacter argillaceus]